MHLDFLYPALFLLAMGGGPSMVNAAKPKNAILLSEVRSLTLRGDKQTTHRRVPAVPQLKCVSHKSVCALHKVDTMRCVNQGSSYSSEDVEWSCTASLPRELKLGATDVVCEGYASADDPYVLKGSCAVEYRLLLTDEGERRYPHLAGGGGGGERVAAWTFWLVFVAVLLFILYSACVRDPQRGARPPGRNNFWGGGGGGGGGWGPGWGGGGGGWSDPPPPYPGSKPSSEGWRPGFWSGLAGGAAAGYMAGNRARNGSERMAYPGGSTWGGPGGAGPSRWGGGGSSSSSSSSGARHESTGFGSTSRR